MLFKIKFFKEGILREQNALKEDNFGLKKNAREALDGL
jgi:hypothetical protein